MHESFLNIAREVRAELVALYGDFLAGKCIEASEKIVQRIGTELGVDAVTVEGWCQFDDEGYGSDRPWDPHTWVEVPALGLYIDVTADQFNFGMFAENDYAEVVVREGLPHGMRYDEPNWNEYEEENFMITLDEILRDAESRRSPTMPEKASKEERAAVLAFRKENPGLTLETSGWDGCEVTFRNVKNWYHTSVVLYILPENYKGEQDGFTLTADERKMAYDALAARGIPVDAFVIESARMIALMKGVNEKVRVPLEEDEVKDLTVGSGDIQYDAPRVPVIDDLVLRLMDAEEKAGRQILDVPERERERDF